VNGTRYGIVSTAGSYTLLYNKDLVPNPPTTFAQFEQTAKDLTKGDQYGLAFRTTLPEANGMWQDLWNYVYGFGGAWSDGTNLTLNSPDTVKGLEMYQQLYNDNVIPAGATASTYRQMFADGKVAMEIDNGGTADNLKTLNPNLNLGAVQIPFPVQSTGEVVAVTGINAASKNTAASETFIKWLLEPAQQVRILNVSGTGGSVATAAVPTPDMVTAQPLQPVFNASTAVALPQIVLGFEDKTPDIRKIVVQQVIAALQGQMTMQQAMDQAQQQATQAVG
jgi:multiple sugar transport system substrate-binding protein